MLVGELGAAEGFGAPACRVHHPPGDSAWRLVDAAGWRAKPFGGAMFSDKHANFLINTGEATAADLEGLGEAVRADVKARFGADLEWEIKRVGRAGA